MRRFFPILLLGLLAIVLGACGGDSGTGITPTPDKLTFLFFYTDYCPQCKAMEPLVHALEETYQDQIEFRTIDAKSSDGKRAFRAFALSDYPSFVLLDPMGEVLWWEVGEHSRGEFELIFKLVLIRLY